VIENYLDPFTLRIVLAGFIFAFTAVFYLFCRLIGPK
jgi:hypothetical protein